MKIGIPGGGNVGGALGLSWARTGHKVFFGVRKPNSPGIAAALAKARGKAHAGSPAEAVNFGDVTVNALPCPATKETLGSLDLSGKILLDCSNPLLPDLSELK
jgi:predicted dinucleotide-binding enzyme